MIYRPYVKVRHRRINYFSDGISVKIKKNDFRSYQVKEFTKDFLEPFGFVYKMTNLENNEKSKAILSEARKGCKNPMYNKSPYSLWVEKYGVEEADVKMKACLEKRLATREMNKRSKK